MREVVLGSMPHVDELTEPQKAAQRVARRDKIWSARKLYCDIVFSSEDEEIFGEKGRDADLCWFLPGYNVFNLTRFKEPVQCATGLTAGFIRCV